MARWLSRCAVVVFLVPLAVRAEVELTPQIGFRLGGEAEFSDSDSNLETTPVLGLTADLSLAPEKWVPLLWSHQRTRFDAPGLLPDRDSFELDVDFIHAGGMYRPERDRAAQPFVMVTAGVTWVRPEPGSFDDELGLSLMVGGGVKVPLGARVDLRIDGRIYLTFSRITLRGSCGGVNCSIGFSGAGVTQLDGLVGLTFGL